MKIKHLPESAKNFNRRVELKYRLNLFQYQKLRIAIQPYMKTDDFTRTAPEKKYLVRSLYFDTYNYSLNYKKISGKSDRVNFRLRTYSEEMNDHGSIRVEIKARNANMIEKYGVFVSNTDYCYFMQHGHWINHVNPILVEFERYLHLRNLRPKVLIGFYREAYEDRMKENLRITFDHKVCSAHADTLFPSIPLFFREHYPLEIVMEIKFKSAQPLWLKKIVLDHGMKLISNSKFSQGIQLARQDLIYPNGVVIYR